MNLKLSFKGVVDLPPGLPELSEWKSISINLKLPFSGGGLICHLICPEVLE